MTRSQVLSPLSSLDINLRIGPVDAIRILLPPITRKVCLNIRQLFHSFLERKHLCVLALLLKLRDSLGMLELDTVETLVGRDSVVSRAVLMS